MGTQLGRRYLGLLLAYASLVPLSHPALAAPPSKAPGDLDAARLAAADQEPQNWFTGGRDKDGSYYSPLSNIDANNVKQLGLAVNLFHDALSVCRQIEIDRALFYAFDQAIGPERDAFDIRRFGQRGEDHIRPLGQGARRIRPFRARL